jgi:hypothetical protein
LSAENVIRCKQRRNAAVLDIDVVHVLDARVNGRRRQQIAIDYRVAVRVQLIDVRIVHDTVVVDHAGGQTEGKNIADGHIEHDVRIQVIAVGAIRLAVADAGLTAEARDIGLAHDVAHVAGKGP